jgi:hypothetical protein
MLNSFECRNILKLGDEFKISSNIDIIKHLKDINWIRRKKFIQFLIQISIIKVNNIEIKEE